MHTGFWWGDLRERGQLGKIMFTWILKKVNEGAWTGLIWLWIGTGGRHECGNEPLSSIKCGEFREDCCMKLVRIFVFRYKFLTTLN